LSNSLDNSVGPAYFTIKDHNCLPSCIQGFYSVYEVTGGPYFLQRGPQEIMSDFVICLFLIQADYGTISVKDFCMAYNERCSPVKSVPVFTSNPILTLLTSPIFPLLSGDKPVLFFIYFPVFFLLSGEHLEPED